MDISKITTLGQLKAAGYKTRSIKEELRDNLIAKLKKKDYQANPDILLGAFNPDQYYLRGSILAICGNSVSDQTIIASTALALWGNRLCLCRVAGVRIGIIPDRYDQNSFFGTDDSFGGNG